MQYTCVPSSFFRRYLGGYVNKFCVGIPSNTKANSVFVVVENYSKMTYFIPGKKNVDVLNIASIFFREVVHLHGILKSVTSDKTINFLLAFGLLCGSYLTPF